jgi:hypothetical protein
MDGVKVADVGSRWSPRTCQSRSRWPDGLLLCEYLVSGEWSVGRLMKEL